MICNHCASWSSIRSVNSSAQHSSGSMTIGLFYARLERCYDLWMPRETEPISKKDSFTGVKPNGSNVAKVITVR